VCFVGCCEIVDGLMEFFSVSKIGCLFALHGEHNDFVNKGEFFEVCFVVAFGFGKFDSLREKILGHDLLNFIGMFFFVVDPADELIGVFAGVFG